MDIQRESMDCDVLIVGAGPAGLSAAIRLAQLNSELNITVLEKAASIGGHLLSGAILEPDALTELLPNWQDLGAPVKTAVTQEYMFWLSAKKHYSLPHLPAMKNQGNYIISLDQLCQWLASQAEALGINIFPGFAAVNALLDDNDKVIGVQTGDMGLDKEGQPTDRFQPGINIHAKQTLLCEGCRGSLTETIIKQFNLRDKHDPQTYGIGLKEIWHVDNTHHQPGTVIHSVGWPLDNKTYGGSFIYHLEDNKIAVGYVVGLDYTNPYLDPFKEFQRFKTHPSIAPYFENGECIEYGSRALNEGGWQSLPKLSFPGGLILGCAAGMVNIAKIKGIHNAIRSGIIAAECVNESLNQTEITHYTQSIKQSAIGRELYQVRNVRHYFRYGLWPAMLMTGVDQIVFRGKTPYTLHLKIADHNTLHDKHQVQPIDYPKPNGKLTFDRLTQVFLSKTRHREDQPCHLHLHNPTTPIQLNLAKYDAPEQRYCPAGVYEIIQDNEQPRLQINFTNCVHCKTCDIKDPSQNIQWTPPEGGDGPNYTEM